MTTKSGSSADIFTTGITIDLTSPSLSGSSTDPMETIPLILTPPVSIPSFPPVSIIDPSVNPRSSLLSFLHPTPHKASYPPAITSTGPSPSPSNLPANSNTTTPVSAPPLAKLCDTTPLFFIDASGNTTSNPCSNYPDPLETSAMESISVVHAPEAPVSLSMAEEQERLIREADLENYLEYLKEYNHLQHPSTLPDQILR
ncbi:hypothetical protein Pst134EA_028837 [Puccinia striiformis f. sp. tritici]|uniref:hypothetical protein n=1 Tax=Puccinia striiformis f. sp. tritici TaxID=168172 RepID=UPI0020086089|nr:hypothetical protein Pst134EA_028837 [Puccinia striiformis f. sp. tritici]KAH9446851.1 hypothetical protein Pst134EA_028837 [Puccinia striiformis f. sp. tritici]